MIISNCSICLGDLLIKEELSALSCGHIYHYKCISTWLENKKECPKCRFKLKANNYIKKLYFDNNPEMEEDNDYREKLIKLKSSFVKFTNKYNELKDKYENNKKQQADQQKQYEVINSLHQSLSKELDLLR